MTIRTITRFSNKLLLASFLLFPLSANTAEFEPFAVVKVSSVNSLVMFADKFVAMAGVNPPEYRDFIRAIKAAKGVDLNGIAGLGAVADDDGSILPFVMLPVTDLWELDIPSLHEPGISLQEEIKSFLVKKEDGRTGINLPIGSYVALQKQGYLVIVPESLVDQVPAELSKLFAGLEKYTLGLTIDLEKIDDEAIDKEVFTPILMVTAMADPQVAEEWERNIEIYRELYKETREIYFGLSIDPKTADVECTYGIVPRPSSGLVPITENGKSETIFEGFRGEPETTVFAYGDSGKLVQLILFGLTYNKTIQQIGEEINRDAMEGIIGLTTAGDPDGEYTELVKKISESYLKAFDADSKKESTDITFSFSTDAVFMAAITTAALDECRTIAGLIGEIIGKYSNKTKIFLEEHIKKDYATVDDFHISRISLPYVKTAATLVTDTATEEIPQVINDLDFHIFWATKEGDQQAFAFAAGLDFAKTESAFKTALEKTGKAVPVVEPEGVISVPMFGQFLNQTLHPITIQLDEESTPGVSEFNVALEKFANVLQSSDSDAIMTWEEEMKPNRIEFHDRISGKAIQALISAVKAVITEELPVNIPGIEDF